MMMMVDSEHLPILTELPIMATTKEVWLSQSLCHTRHMPRYLG